MGSSERGRDPLLGRDDLEMRSSVSDDEAEEQKPLSVSGKALVLILFCILTLIATFEKVALKKATDSLNLYQVFLNQLIVSLFIIVFLGVVVYKSRVRRPATLTTLLAALAAHVAHCLVRTLPPQLRCRSMQRCGVGAGCRLGCQRGRGFAVPQHVFALLTSHVAL